jgi:hypothetical protein
MKMYLLTYSIVEKLKRDKQLGISRRRWEEIIKMIHKEIDGWNVELSYLA